MTQTEIYKLLLRIRYIIYKIKLESIGFACYCDELTEFENNKMKYALENDAFKSLEHSFCYDDSLKPVPPFSYILEFNSELVDISRELETYIYLNDDEKIEDAFKDVFQVWKNVYSEIQLNDHFFILDESNIDLNRIDQIIKDKNKFSIVESHNPNIKYFPKELNTERAKKAFDKAIDLKYMRKTENGFQWLYGDNKSKARLGYFIMKVCCPNNTETIPETAINTLFGVSRIGSAITQTLNAKKPQKWRQEIDKLFD